MSSPIAVGRPEAVDAARREPLLLDDAVEDLARVVVELARGRADRRVVEDRREPALQLPRGEEERPVDERHELLERRLDDAPADEPGHRRSRACPSRSSGEFARACVERQQRLLAPLRRTARAARPGRRARRPRTSSRCRSLSRLDTTSTARDASSTCTVAPEYSGAIFTAVCCLLVVAPPMSSGVLSCRAAPSPSRRAPSRRATA